MWIENRPEVYQICTKLGSTPHPSDSVPAGLGIGELHHPGAIVVLPFASLPALGMLPSLSLLWCWCREGDSNPHERNAQRVLSPPRLPFRHPGALRRRVGHNCVMGSRGEKGDAGGNCWSGLAYRCCDSLRPFEATNPAVEADGVWKAPARPPSPRTFPHPSEILGALPPAPRISRSSHS